MPKNPDTREMITFVAGFVFGAFLGGIGVWIMLSLSH